MKVFRIDLHQRLTELQNGRALARVTRCAEIQWVAREQSLKGACETGNPENIQYTCAGKFSAKENGVRFGHCTVDFGPGEFPRGLLPIRNGVDRGDREFGCASGEAGAGGFD